MGQCKVCGKNVDDKYELCFTCHEKVISNDSSDEITTEDISSLSYQKLKFHKDVIKGRIAETLIEELFLAMDWNVFRYGMENTVPGVVRLLKGVQSEVADNIRRMPDFVVQDKNGECYFIEVKFRSNGEFFYSDLKPDYPYRNAYIVLVSKKHIKCISVKELKRENKISPDNRYFLGDREEFDLDRDTIIKFCKFAEKLFDQV
jgi:hypothetical protein